MAKQIQQLNKAVFLDRDGVLNHDSGYVYKTDDLIVLPGVSESLKALKENGYLLIVITNQSGVARGMYSMNQVATFHDHLRQTIKSLGGPDFDGIYVCPHHPKGSDSNYAYECSCRKPAPGLILEAIKDFGIDPAASWMIGDKDSDAQAAKSAGVRAILIESAKYEHTEKDVTSVRTLNEAVKTILQSPGKS